MKKLLMFVGVVAFIAFNQISNASCVNCNPDSQRECHRVTQGNTVHIFYGTRTSCQ